MQSRIFRIFFSAMLASAFVQESAAQIASPWVIKSGSGYSLATPLSLLQTEYFRVEQWGVVFTKSAYWHDVYYYPTANDRNDAGISRIDGHKIAIGDFDGDGRKDVAINWKTDPLTLVRPKIAPSLLHNVNGQLVLWPEQWSGEPPERTFSYKISAVDFNGDRKDDLIAADMSMIGPKEPIPIMISSPDGRLRDATRQIQGQESGDTISTFTFAHDLAVGDINGDGVLDFYQGRHLFLGDGKGSFTLRNDLLPEVARPSSSWGFMSSVIGDLDGDGVGDLVIAYPDKPLTFNEQDVGKNGWIFLSNGSGGIATGRQVALPPGRYGVGSTKFNTMRIADLDGDRRPDIVIGQTRSSPYYQGRTLQVLMNRGNGLFVDETDLRIVGDDRFDSPQGEGQLAVIDVNGDSFLDIVDSATGVNGFAVFINDGKGFFHLMPRSLIPRVRQRDIVGHEGSAGTAYGDDDNSTTHLYPIVLDNNGVSFLVQFDHGPQSWPQKPGDSLEQTFYVIRALKPYSPVSASPPPATSVGPFDGIYVWSDGNYLSLHQDSSQMIATIYFNDNTSVDFKAASGDVLKVPQLDIFDLLSGAMTGTTAKVSGTRFHRACNVSYDFAFGDNSKLTVTRTNVSNTAIANASGISCSSIIANESPTMTMNKVPFGAAASTPAFAVGQYDGIYVWADGNYLSLHQDGADFIATNYFNDNTSVDFRAASGGVLTTPQLDVFDLLSGSVTGSTAKIKGTKFHRACNVTYDFTFSGNVNLTATRTGISNTPLADAAGISCSALLGTDSATITMQKVLFGR